MTARQVLGRFVLIAALSGCVAASPSAPPPTATPGPSSVPAGFAVAVCEGFNATAELAAQLETLSPTIAAANAIAIERELAAVKSTLARAQAAFERAPSWTPGDPAVDAASSALSLLGSGLNKIRVGLQVGDDPTVVAGMTALADAVDSVSVAAAHLATLRVTYGLECTPTGPPAAAHPTAPRTFEETVLALAPHDQLLCREFARIDPDTKRQRLADHITKRVDCSGSGQWPDVILLLVASAVHVEVHWEATIFPSATGEPCLGGSFRGRYSVGGSPRGRIACDPGDPAITWTVDEERIVADAEAPIGWDAGRLYDWWKSTRTVSGGSPVEISP
jgi:hypothetical protein